MSVMSQLEAEVLGLVSQLSEETAGDEAVARLEELVVASSSARRAYLAAIDLLAGLEWGALGQRLPVAVEADDFKVAEPPQVETIPPIDIAELFGVELSPADLAQSKVSRPTIVKGVRAWLVQKPTRALLATALVYYGLAVGLFYSLQVDTSRFRNSTAVWLPSAAPQADGIAANSGNSSSPQGNRPTAPGVHGMPAAVPAFTARLVAGRKPQFSGTAGQDVGSELPLRRYDLLGGTAEVEFGNGARAVFSAPATFDVVSAERVRLMHGTVSSWVPPRGVGFAVETPTAEVVDLGTEFEVAVAKSGETKVSVLVGAVDVVPTVQSGPAHNLRRRRLTGGEMARVGTAGWLAERSDKLAGKFVQSVAHRPYGPELVEQGGGFAPQNLATLPPATPFASSCLPHPLHKIEHLNDGTFGNAHSWVADGEGRQFAGIAFGGKYTIDSFAFGRDNTGQLAEAEHHVYDDRCAGRYILQVTTVENPGVDTPDSDWREVGTIDHPDREVDIAIGRFKPYARHRYRFRPMEATGIRLIVPGSGAAIDEIEVYPVIASPQENASQE